MSETPPNPYGSPADPEREPTGSYQGPSSPYGGQPNPYQPAGQAPGYAGGYPPQDHPQATTVLIIGILSLLLCSIAGPFAWVMGNRVVSEIDSSGGRIGGRSSANAGRICGIIATVFMALSAVAVVLIVLLVIGTA